MSVSIILAAGEGTRMKSKLPKVLHKIGGKPILDYVITASKKAGIKKNVVIIGHGGSKVKKAFNDREVIFEEQPIGEDAPYGTGYAVKQGINHVSDDDTVIVLCGDTPLVTKDTISNLKEFHDKGKYDGTVLTAVLEDATGYGRIVRDKNGNIEKITEEKDANEKEKEIKEINTGIYAFKGRLLIEALNELDDNNAQGELYITDVIEILKTKGYNLGACIIDDFSDVYGINSKEQLAFCEKVLRKRINTYHMEQGVTLIDPENTYIDQDVKIGKDTVIYPGVFLQGSTIIGEDCTIYSQTRIVNSKIGDNTEIESSLIEESEVGNLVHIGPNAHLRPRSILGNNIKIGNFVEVKNSKLGDGVKAGHLAYIGDGIVGKNVNIGCGVIFANYDGENKNKTIIGDNAFIGSNSNLVAPVNIGDNAYVAAGSTITEDVSEGSLSIARARQVNKDSYVRKKD